MGSVTMNPLFRSESFGYNYYYPDQNYTMMEKRQLFLRSYQFCRKKTLTERIKGSLVRAKKVVWLRLRYARGLRRLVFFPRFKCAFYYRRRRFSQLLNTHNRKPESSSCFWISCVLLESETLESQDNTHASNNETVFSGKYCNMRGRLYSGKAARAKGCGGGPFVC